MGNVDQGGNAMRILTYADPFKLKENYEIWKLITTHPHYCASDTLVQGMNNYYGRESFSIIRPLQDLIKQYMKAYAENPINDMNLYLEVTNVIRSWPESPLKQSFMFNKTHIVEAMQILMPLEFDSSKMEKNLMTEEQRKLLEIYDAILDSDCYNAFRRLKKQTWLDYVESIRLTLPGEVRYLIDDDLAATNKLSENGINPRPQTIGEALRAAELLVPFYEESAGSENKAVALRSVIKASSLKDNEYYSTIIIHGVHRFTPEIIYLLRDLDKRLKVNIIFLIPYAKDLPAIYGTWERAYEWTHTEFEYISSLSPSRQPEADEMEKIFCGEGLPVGEKKEILAYDNLTTFALHEVGTIYAKTIDPEHGNKGNLNKMKKQYYAVKGRECNELLKMFYPEQFRSKPFLSYPIGQLILGIYRMWDFDQNRMAFDVDTLIECAASGVFQDGANVGGILRKTKLYFRGAEKLEEYQERIQNIRKFIREEKTDKTLSGLKHLSYLNLDMKECQALDLFINRLNETAIKLFSGDTKRQINYIQHFNRLMDIISDAANSDNRVLPDAERELIQSIKDQLNTNAREPVMGSLQDVGDALAFFLSSRLDKDSSNWIVRDFEQIDGAVLLSPKTKAQVYHFALLSNEHMLKQNQDELPWPLTTSFFDAYGELQDEILAISSSIREHRSFLKFVLFYGTHYSCKNVEFSFITEEDDEEQTPYYLFTAMGYQPKPASPLTTIPFLLARDEDQQQQLHFIFSDDEESMELFSICPFKYLMSKVMCSDIDYSSEYHVTYFLRYYLTYLGRFRNEKNNKDKVKEALKTIRCYFPYLGESTFNDLIRDAESDLNKYKFYSETIHKRKLNFLVASWNTETWKANFKESNPKKKMIYMNSAEIYPKELELPRNSFCEYCNFEGICLRDFYMNHDEETEEIV